MINIPFALLLADANPGTSEELQGMVEEEEVNQEREEEDGQMPSNNAADKTEGKRQRDGLVKYLYARKPHRTYNASAAAGFRREASTVPTDRESLLRSDVCETLQAFDMQQAQI